MHSRFPGLRFAHLALFVLALLFSGLATARADEPMDVTFDDIKLGLKKDEKFERSDLTDRVKELHKKELRIRGYILPASVFKQKGIKQFVLVRDNMECCFGPGAAIYDCIMIEMTSGNSADFTTRPVAVEGTFTIKEYEDFDGNLLAIYHMHADKVK